MIGSIIVDQSFIDLSLDKKVLLSGIENEDFSVLLVLFETYSILSLVFLILAFPHKIILSKKFVGYLKNLKINLKVFSWKFGFVESFLLIIVYQIRIESELIAKNIFPHE